MRITGSPRNVRLGNPYVRVIRGMSIRTGTSCDVVVTCKHSVYGLYAGSLRCLDEGTQESVCLLYGACTGPYVSDIGFGSTTTHP